jgi:hypothetical protein
MMDYKFKDFDVFSVYFSKTGFSMSADVSNMDNGWVSQDILLQSDSSIPRVEDGGALRGGKIYGMTGAAQ